MAITTKVTTTTVTAMTNHREKFVKITKDVGDIARQAGDSQPTARVN